MKEEIVITERISIVDRFLGLAEKFKYTNFLLAIGFLGDILFNQKSVIILFLAFFIFFIESVNFVKGFRND